MPSKSQHQVAVVSTLTFTGTCIIITFACLVFQKCLFSRLTSGVKGEPTCLTCFKWLLWCCMPWSRLALICTLLSMCDLFVCLLLLKPHLPLAARMQALFPDNCYSHDSGGDPTVIPKLSFEQFQVSCQG
eukprot:GHRR01034755.1.p1 GENE.GHRR01034755.1~~GHRR01034755.1.p1  ORF type:complete len:130 (-),score=7.24 GHRR01034755.1:48-437(-)